MGFKPGDCVVIKIINDTTLGARRGTVANGMKGVVLSDSSTKFNSIGVMFDEYHPGRHTCNDTVENGRGWYVSLENLVHDNARNAAKKELGVREMITNHRKGKRYASTG